MIKIADIINDVIEFKQYGNENLIKRVRDITNKFPLFAY